MNYSAIVQERRGDTEGGWLPLIPVMESHLRVEFLNRRGVEWRKNRFRILVEREPLPMDKGQRLEIPYVHGLTARDSKQ